MSPYFVTVTNRQENIKHIWKTWHRVIASHRRWEERSKYWVFWHVMISIKYQWFLFLLLLLLCMEQIARIMPSSGFLHSITNQISITHLFTNNLFLLLFSSLLSIIVFCVCIIFALLKFVVRGAGGVESRMIEANTPATVPLNTHREPRGTEMHSRNR